MTLTLTFVIRQLMNIHRKDIRYYQLYVVIFVFLLIDIMVSFGTHTVTFYEALILLPS